MGAACSRSSALPWGIPSITSTRTTSARRCETIQCAAECPTFPAPTIVTLARVLATRLPLHAVDDGRGELAGAHFVRSLHEPRQVIGNDLPPERGFQAADDQ